ncbi:MAG: hypothetical protein Ct9H90mP14_2420 [Methanobacteriota archaeon]|nr:MAG: hypothetical protein Ct9H90mP14_2420 [Euryarchaeota archaeon]
MEALKKATGGNIITNIDDLSDGDLGQAAKVKSEKLEILTWFSSLVALKQRVLAYYFEVVRACCR